MINNRLLSQWPGLWIHSFSSYAAIDRSTASNGDLSLRLYGAKVVGKDPVFYPCSVYLPLPEEKLSTGEYTLEFSARTRNIVGNPKVKITLICVTEDGKKISKEFSIPTMRSDSDWKKYKLPFSINTSMLGPCLNIILHDHNDGVFWIDNIRLKNKDKQQ